MINGLKKEKVKTILKDYNIETLTLRTLETITEKDLENLNKEKVKTILKAP